MTQHDDFPADLALLADALVAVESSSSLLVVLEDLLTRIQALPAMLYLYDGAADAFYPAAAFGCPNDGIDIPRHAMPPNSFLLLGQGNPVGVLRVVSEWDFDHGAVKRLAALLGPTLLHLHRNEQAMGELRRANELAIHLISAGQLLQHLDVEVLLTKILETVLGAVKAEVGAVITPDASGTLKVRVAWGLDDQHLDAIRMSDGQKVVDAVHQRRVPVALSKTDIATAMDVAQLQGHLESLLVLPLAARERSHGVVVMANAEGGLDRDAQRLPETLCAMAAIALDNALLVKATVEQERLQQEMSLARTVQMGMFPPAGLQVDQVRVAGVSRPCSETGGDYFSYLERKGRLIAMIGDVSGHGLGAALFTTMAHAIVQQQLRTGVDLENAFKQLNEGLALTNSGRFMTAAVVEVDPAAGTFSYTSAGHNPLLWIHDGKPVWLESTGFPLGIMAEGDFPMPPAQVYTKGDLIVMYTDGITEATNPANECFGDERLSRTVIDAPPPPIAVSERVLAAVDAFASGKTLEDDLTIVVVAL